MAEDKKLSELRDAIDATDSTIMELLNKRASLATEVAEVKKANGQDTFFYRPEREAQVLQRVIETNQGPLSSEEAARIFREIMSACLALELPLQVAYLGPEGTFTQAAALKHFGHSVKPVALPTIDHVFREVEAGNAHYGVVPIENSIEGVVNHTLDLLINSSLKICGEVELRIHHHLLTNAGKLEEIDTIYGHQQALAQCRKWLDENMFGIKRKDVNSNAVGAKLAVDEKNTAAIASEAAAEMYGLNILVRNIENEPDNTTRFLILGKRDTPASGKDKTSILFSTVNKPGALHDLLSCFADNNVSLTRIESRPSRKGMWDYVFFADFEGHVTDAKVQKTMAQLEDCASLVKVLGSYPQAVL